MSDRRGSLKYALNGVYSGGTPTAGDDSFYDKNGTPFVTIGDMSSQAPILSTKRHVSEEGRRSKHLKMVEKGTILLSMYATIGLPNILGVSSCISQAIIALYCRTDQNTRFLYWWLLHYRRILEAEVAGSTQGNLSAERVKEIRYRFIDLDTQIAIADFLDRETARIDQLIEKKERFAELVLERRLAIVSKAVTGTTDDMPWLSALPEDWKAERAKFHFRESQKRSATGDEELLTVSHITGVTKRSEKDVNMFMAESNEGYKLVAPRDLIINTMWAWMGAMGVSSENGLISPSYGVYTLISDALRPAFVDLMVRSKPFVAEATRRSKGIHSSRLRLYPDAFLDIWLPIPPLETQDIVLKDIAERTAREGALLKKNKEAETLLREFRSALITAAVTGQIDVTTWGKHGKVDRRLDQIEAEMAV